MSDTAPRCEHCECSVFERPLYRANPKGELPAKWLCELCGGIPIDKETKRICDIIINDNKL